MAESPMMDLMDFRRRFDACLAEVGQPPPRSMHLDAAGWLTIKGETDASEYLSALVQALRLTAATYEPAARLLEATERELTVGAEAATGSDPAV